ncbi:MAG: hypothetical protein QOD01_699 [Actinomycetota bacterium]|nr:hypothetical protein [Actinomycetota bacterium]
MATFQEIDGVEVVGGRTRHARRLRVRIAAVSLAAAIVTTLPLSLAIGHSAGAGVNALNPQPIPPGRHGGQAVVALNPQPLPPGVGMVPKPRLDPGWTKEG